MDFFWREIILCILRLPLFEMIENYTNFYLNHNLDTLIFDHLIMIINFKLSLHWQKKKAWQVTTELCQTNHLKTKF
ncbi:hypothetical protein BpHYR1_014735 [Brachionus plicatilis]|uniref:Uncharacterized protein n=1 Tax=Brachionus plicatilis TaxID=10195 RepID=A0A3M7T796_BRAPC|nr:hypothetical protein BpHYR1_014735 [Brachionus plicatilis]